MCIIKEVCLDTSVIKKIVHEDTEYPELFTEIASRKGVMFKIAEMSWVELMDDLNNDSIKIDEWKNVRDRINSFLYQACPIQEMGYNLSVEMDVYKERKVIIGPYNFDYWRKCWRLLLQMENKNDLKRRIFFYHSYGPHSIKINPNAIRSTIEAERNIWFKYFKSVAETANDNMTLYDIIDLYKSEFEEVYNIEKALDLIHIISYYTFLFLQKRPYKPESKKRKNDAIDFSFFQILSKPIIFCTDEQKMIKLINNSEAPNKNNIMNIEDILEYYK